MSTKALVEVFIDGHRTTLLEPKNRANNNILKPGVIGIVRNVADGPNGAFIVWNVDSQPERYRIINPDGVAIDWESFSKKRPGENKKYIMDLSEEERYRHQPSESYSLRFAFIIDFPGEVARGAYIVDDVIYKTRSDFAKWRDEYVGVSQ